MKMNPTYTKADPVSLCSTIIIIGTRIISAVMIKSFILPILYPSWLMKVASIREVDILDISAGWNLTGPNSNHDREPFTSMPRKITAISSRITPAYIGTDRPSYILGLSAKSMITARTNEVSIHTNCLPLLHSQSKMDVGSDEWTDA